MRQFYTPNRLWFMTRRKIAEPTPLAAGVMTHGISKPATNPNIACRPDQGRLNSAVAAQTKRCEKDSVVVKRLRVSTEVPAPQWFAGYGLRSACNIWANADGSEKGQNLRVLALALIVHLITISVCQSADPFRPNDGDVVEVLPSTPLINRDQMVILRQKLSADPLNTKLAAAAADRYMKMGKASSDPRYYGYALAAIKPWETDAEPPAAIIKIRAKLNEKDHNYDASIAELESLVQREPRDVQAWVELANLYRVKGEYDKAWAACGSLKEFGSDIQLTASNVPLMAVTGKAEQAYSILSKMLPDAKEVNPALEQWVLLMQADVARILGRFQDAEKHYQSALEIDAEGTYLKRAYAEFLLDRDRPVEALEMIRDQRDDNGSLLLAAIAAKRSEQKYVADGWKSQLEKRYEEIRLRGSQPHGRFESRFELELNDQPAKALELALTTWEAQKEARDMRNVLQSAVAAENPDAASPVLEFMKANGTEDAELRRLAEQLEKL